MQAERRGRRIGRARRPVAGAEAGLAALDLLGRVSAGGGGHEGDAADAFGGEQRQHARDETAHGETDQHEALRRQGEDAPRHAVERGVLVDVAEMDAPQRGEVRDHVGPQILVAHEAGQQDEVTQRFAVSSGGGSSSDRHHSRNGQWTEVIPGIRSRQAKAVAVLGTRFARTLCHTFQRRKLSCPPSSPSPTTTSFRQASSH